jgi:catechol-2,3-dioxygenase
MIIEHIGISVSKPVEMAQWYKNNLGCKIQFKSGSEAEAKRLYRRLTEQGA